MSLPSRTSSEPGTERARRAFRRRVLAVLGVLLVASVGLALAASLQGPRVTDLRYDATALVTRPGQTLLLSLSRPVEEVAEGAIRVEPAAAARVDPIAGGLLVRFDAALDASTRYRIMVDVQPVGGAAGTVEATIETAPLVVTTLQRGETGRDDSVDQIIDSGLDGATATLYRGSRITGFARFDDSTLLVAEGDAWLSRLTLQTIGGGPFEEFALPEPGRVDALGAVGTNVLFSFTSLDADPLPAHDGTLMRIDLTGDHLPVPVLGLDGEPIAVHDWRPIPGSGDVLLSARGGQLLRYTPTGEEPPLPLGQHFPLVGVVGDGSAAVVADSFGPLLLDLATGAEERITVAPIDGTEPFLGEVAVAAGGRLVAKVVVAGDSGAFESRLIVDDGDAVRTVPVPPGTPVASFSVSPSGQYLFVVLDSREAGQAAAGPTLVVELATLEHVATLPGVDPAW